jgi:hypothetical protein
VFLISILIGYRQFPFPLTLPTPLLFFRSLYHIHPLLSSLQVNKNCAIIDVLLARVTWQLLSPDTGVSFGIEVSRISFSRTLLQINQILMWPYTLLDTYKITKVKACLLCVNTSFFKGFRNNSAYLTDVYVHLFILLHNRYYTK